MARSSDPKKLALWQGRFRRFLDSGSAVARFCAIEHVSESSFYYWQKRLGAQARRRPTRAEGRGACSEDRSVRAEGRGTGAADYGVFQPVTVVPGVCGVLVRLPGGTQIEVGAEHLDAIRAVMAETVRADRSEEADQSSCLSCRADRQHGGAASC
jgi:hypothetical protein